MRTLGFLCQPLRDAHISNGYVWNLNEPDRPLQGTTTMVGQLLLELDYEISSVCETANYLDTARWGVLLDMQ